ncbi:MAG TPA: hypothetical protein DCP11_05620 [Microbacteriaceae bacterium]|nr:hypothetical protein [Microbacteriaceae bacterium]
MTSDPETYCSCCGRTLPRTKLHDIGSTGVYICRRCARWVAFTWRGDRPH